MSTDSPNSSASAAIYDDQQRIPPGEIFDEFVFFNDEYCSCCFNRIRRVDYTEATDTDSLGTEGDVLQSRRRAGTGVLGYDFVVHDSYGVQTVRDEEGRVTGTEPKGSHGLHRTYTTRTYCGNCGANNGRMPKHACSEQDAVRRADRLADTLLEQGIAVQRAALKHFVGEAKRRPNLTTKDHDIYATAVHHARLAFVNALD